MRPRLDLVATVLICGVLAARDLPAQQQEMDRAVAARALFDSAVDLMRARNFAEACPKLEQAVRLVPEALGARLELSRCYEEDGRIGTAWAELLQLERAAVQAGQPERVELARARAAALAPRVPHLTIAVDGIAPDGLVVKRDGRPVEPAFWGVAVPVDPGDHLVTATAPGRTPFAQTVKLAERARMQMLVPVLAMLGTSPPRRGPASSPPPPLSAATSPRPVSAAPSPPSAAPPAADDGAGGRPWWPWLLGGVGVAAAAAAVGFGVDLAGAQRDIDDHCGEASCDRADGFDPDAANERLYRDLGLAVGMGAVGVAAIGVAAWGLLSASEPDKPGAAAQLRLRPWAWPGVAGGLVEGRF